MRPKVLVVSELFWPEGSGAELATYLVTEMLKEFFEVVLVTGTGNPTVPPNVKVVYESLFSKREKPFLWLNTLKLMRTERFRKLVQWADIVYVPRLALPIIPYAKSMGRMTIIHLHDYIPVSYSAAVLAPYEEHKHRITRDDISLECRKGVKYCVGAGLLWWLPKLARRWVAQADRVVCVSRRQAEIVSSLVPELGSKVEVAYNPPPPKLLSRSVSKDLDDTPTLLYVGGDRYVKGFHILLQALEELGRRRVRARFILAGSYSYGSLKNLKTLERKYENLKIGVLGRSSYEEVLNLHRHAWASIFPSILEEPLPYAAVEAMLAGTIPVASRVGGVPEIVAGTIAERFLFEPGNVEEFVDRIESLVSLSKGEVMDIGMKLKERASKLFDKGRVEHEIANSFMSLLT
jgi:glycosyltransferase involved in cell wall biosynthesis